MRPFVLGIAGGTASGKTTVAGLVVEALGDQVGWLTHDRYYRPVPEAQAAGAARYNFDHPDSLDTGRLVADLSALCAGQDVMVPRYDFALHDRVGEDLVKSRPILVVEGILVLAEPRLADCFDHAVFVEAPDDVRLIRRIRRDMAERGRVLGDILAQWERTIGPMHRQFVGPSRLRAHQVLDGESDPVELAESVLAMLPRVR